MFFRFNFPVDLPATQYLILLDVYHFKHSQLHDCHTQVLKIDSCHQSYHLINRGEGSSRGRDPCSLRQYRGAVRVSRHWLFVLFFFSVEVNSGEVCHWCFILSFLLFCIWFCIHFSNSLQYSFILFVLYVWLNFDITIFVQTAFEILSCSVPNAR